MFKKFLGLDNWTKLVVVFLLVGALATISYGRASSNTKLNAASSRNPGDVSAAGTLQLTATSIRLTRPTTRLPERSIPSQVRRWVQGRPSLGAEARPSI